MFSLAVVVNIFNWIYQTKRLEKFITGVRAKQGWLHIGFASFATLVSLAYLFFVVAVCSLDGEYITLMSIFTLVYAITFFFIGAIFAVVGWLFYRKYSSLTETSSAKFRCRIFQSVLVISITFILRGFVNIGKDKVKL